jgi:acyl-CoA thioester hydrolase
MAVTIDIPVRWGEMDAFGHVNNTVFFRWFEDVRIATFLDVQLATHPTGVGPILASTTCDFLAPVTFPATVRATCTIDHVGTTSFVMRYAADVRGVAVAKGSGVVVLLDYATGTKVPLPDDLRTRLLAHRTQ